MNNLSNGLVPTERLQKIASWREKYGNNHNVMIPAEEAELLARELLAYREAAKEPVAWRCNSTGPNSHFVTLSKVVADSWNYKGIKSIPLYAAPPLPAVNSPVIPDGWALVPIEATPEMLNASWIHHSIHCPSAWRTMIAAAPKPGGGNETK